MKIWSYIVLVKTLFISGNYHYAQTWEKISEYELTGHIYSLQFDSFGNFYAAANNGLFCSTDKGTTWKNLYPTHGFNACVSNILIPAKNELFISSNDGILHSTDGGLNWSGNPSNIGMEFLVMDKDENIYAGWEAIYKSTDRGHSWNVIKDSLYTWSFYITHMGILLAGTTCGIYLSADNGNNWIRTGFFDCGDVTIINGTTNDEVIFIAGADRFRGIRYTTDGGYNWEFVSNSDTVRWGSSIIPINNNEIFFGSQFNGVFKYNVQEPGLADYNNGLQYGVSAMAYDSLGYLYAASHGIYRSKSTLDSNKYLRNSVYSYTLAQNYPNPFNISTTIEYSLENSGNVYLSVFNLLGENVAKILNEFKTKGNHRAAFNAERLASGIYFYQMRIGDFVQTKKMIFLR